MFKQAAPDERTKDASEERAFCSDRINTGFFGLALEGLKQLATRSNVFSLDVDHVEPDLPLAERSVTEQVEPGMVYMEQEKRCQDAEELAARARQISTRLRHPDLSLVVPREPELEKQEGKQLRRNTDLARIGLNWAEAKGFDDTQFTTESFYRFNISPDFQITPSVQYIANPLLNLGSDDMMIVCLRARIVF